MGLGFAVVAGEIRKLSEHSKDSASQITTGLNRTVQQVKEVLTTSQQVNRIGEQQAGGAEQFAAAVEEVNRMAISLNDLANV